MYVWNQLSNGFWNLIVTLPWRLLHTRTHQWRTCPSDSKMIEASFWMPCGRIRAAGIDSAMNTRTCRLCSKLQVFYKWRVGGSSLWQVSCSFARSKRVEHHPCIGGMLFISGCSTNRHTLWQRAKDECLWTILWLPRMLEWQSRNGQRFSSTSHWVGSRCIVYAIFRMRLLSISFRISWQMKETWSASLLINGLFMTGYYFVFPSK